jgi:hypothetical protein
MGHAFQGRCKAEVVTGLLISKNPQDFPQY